MIAFYTHFIYQPFFNLLVGIYYLLHQVPGNPYVDIGIAVIVFTVALRIILLPVTIASNRSEKERREIEDTLKQIHQQYRSDPIKQKQLKRKLWLSNPRVLIAETINFTIQAIIFLMLYRIFAKGLEGADIHLLYSYMPDVPQPYDLMFLGKYDLSHPNLTLNLIQSVVIFAAELISTLTSPFPSSRGEVIRLQIILPIASFIIFSQLPAGKKIFVITTLLFSILYMLLRALRRFFKRFSTPIIQPSPEVTEPTG